MEYAECASFIQESTGCEIGRLCVRKHPEAARFLVQSGLVKTLRRCPHTREHCPFTACPFFHSMHSDAVSGELPQAVVVPHAVVIWDTENVAVPVGSTAAAMLSALQFAVQATAGISGPLATSAFYGSYRRHLPEPVKTSMRLAGATLVDAGKKQGGVDVAMKGALNDTIVAALLQKLEGTSAGFHDPVSSSTPGTSTSGDPAAKGSASGLAAAPAGSRRRPVLVLASGDRDFGDDLRRLRRTGFETIAVHGAESSPDFVALADHALRWEAVAALAQLLSADRSGAAGGTGTTATGRQAFTSSAGPASPTVAEIVSVTGTGECAVPVSVPAAAGSSGRGGRGRGGRGRGRGRSQEPSRSAATAGPAFASTGASTSAGGPSIHSPTLVAATSAPGTSADTTASATAGAAASHQLSQGAARSLRVGGGIDHDHDTGNRSRSTSRARARRAAASAAAAAELAARTVAFAVPLHAASSPDFDASGVYRRDDDHDDDHDDADEPMTRTRSQVASTRGSVLLTATRSVGDSSSMTAAATRPTALALGEGLGHDHRYDGRGHDHRRDATKSWRLDRDGHDHHDALGRGGAAVSGPPFPSLAAAAASSAIRFPILCDALAAGSDLSHPHSHPHPHSLSHPHHAGMTAPMSRQFGTSGPSTWEPWTSVGGGFSVSSQFRFPPSGSARHLSPAPALLWQLPPVQLAAATPRRVEQS